MLQWQIDRLREQVELHTAELRRERDIRNDLQKRLTEARERFDTLTDRLTVGALRSAGVKVEITVPEPGDDCGCCD
jgi:hypothetical protein